MYIEYMLRIERHVSAGEQQAQHQHVRGTSPTGGYLVYPTECKAIDRSTLRMPCDSEQVAGIGLQHERSCIRSGWSEWRQERSMRNAVGLISSKAYCGTEAL